MGNKSAKKNISLCCLLAGLVSYQRYLALLQPASYAFLSKYTEKLLCWLWDHQQVTKTERLNTTEDQRRPIPSKGLYKHLPLMDVRKQADLNFWLAALCSTPTPGRGALQGTAPPRDAARKTSAGTRGTPAPPQHPPPRSQPKFTPSPHAGLGQREGARAGTRAVTRGQDPRLLTPAERLHAGFAAPAHCPEPSPAGLVKRLCSFKLSCN